MTHIINREQIVSQLLKGYGQQITGSFFVKGSQNDPSIRPWPYDLEKAGKLLDEACWIDTDGDCLRAKEGLPFRFKFMYTSESALYKDWSSF
jgi:ABC-type transport system substrate-binding protein